MWLGNTDLMHLLQVICQSPVSCTAIGSSQSWDVYIRTCPFCITSIFFFSTHSHLQLPNVTNFLWSLVTAVLQITSSGDTASALKWWTTRKSLLCKRAHREPTLLHQHFFRSFSPSPVVTWSHWLSMVSGCHVAVNRFLCGCSLICWSMNCVHTSLCQF